MRLDRSVDNAVDYGFGGLKFESHTGPVLQKSLLSYNALVCICYNQ